MNQKQLLQFIRQPEAKYGDDEWYAKRRLLLDTLEEAIAKNSKLDVQLWIVNVNYDPEYYGTFFCQVYRYTIDYFNDISGTHPPLTYLNWCDA